MAKMNEEDMRYIEDGFFSDTANIRLSFDRLSVKYDDSGLDKVIRCICPRIVGEVNDETAVYSLPTNKTTLRFGNDYPTVEKAHKEKGLTWYDINNDGITKKLYGVDSDFVDII